LTSASYSNINAETDKNQNVVVLDINVYSDKKKPASNIFLAQPFGIEVNFVIKKNMFFNLNIVVFDSNENIVFVSPSTTNEKSTQEEMTIGKYTATCVIPGSLLNEGIYHVSLLLVEDLRHVIHKLDKIVSFEMVEDGLMRGSFFGPWGGIVRPKLEWSINAYEGN
jgi:lipopolysaccharide transport system ATP-binding protein